MRPFYVVIASFLSSTIVFAQEAAIPATGAPKAPVNSFMMNLPLLVMGVALFYFMIIAPQKKQHKQQQDFQKSLARGEEVFTTGGLMGKIVGLTDRVVTLEISAGTEVRVLRTQVQGKVKELKIGEVVT